MKRRRLGACCAAFLAALGSAALSPALQAARAKGPSPRVFVEPEAFDFGRVRAGRELTTPFTFRNHGPATLSLGPIQTDCSCTAALIGSNTVPPGGSTSLRVLLRTRAQVGLVEKTVLVQTNDPERPRVVLKVRATVVSAGTP